MLSILARQNLSNFKFSKQLIEPAVKFNLLKPNFTKPQFVQLKCFKTSNRGLFRTKGTKGTKDQTVTTKSVLSNLFESRVFRASTYAVGSSFVFFSLANIWSYEEAMTLRKQFSSFGSSVTNHIIMIL